MAQQGNGEAVTAATPRKKRTSAPKSGAIVVSTNKVVSGEGIEVSSQSNGAVVEFANAQFESIRGEDSVKVEVTNEQGRHLIDVLKKFFGGRGTGSPRKAKS